MTETTSTDQSQQQTADSEDAADEQSRRYGLRDGACQAITQGSGEQYLSAFALLFQASSIHLSILSALPQLIGTVAQLLSVKLLRWFPDRKPLIHTGTIGQALAWIPILVLPLLISQWGPWLVIAGAGLYFACNQFTNPTWNSFITDHLEEHARGAYFARRALIVASLSFAALCAAGGLLSLWQHQTYTWMGFAVIFAAAGGARLLSAMALKPTRDDHHRPQQDSQRGFRSFLADSGYGFHRFLLFSGLMHLAVLVAGPFFVLYMLRDLHLSYLEYGSWLAASLLGQLLTLQAWGRFGDRLGNKALLTVTGLTVPFLPMLYLVSARLAFLMAVNFFGGVIWAGLSLGLQNYVFDVVRPEDRAKAVAVTSTVNALGWSAGAFLGSWLVETLPAHLEWGELALPLASNLPLVFFLSGLLRLAVSTSLLGQFHEGRAVERVALHQLIRELPIMKMMAQLIGSPLSRLSK